jgi:hypothetical protein
MSLAEYIIMFVLVAILGAGLPGPGDAALIAAGTLAGEGRLNVWIVLAVASAAWMLGSVADMRLASAGGAGCSITRDGWRNRAGSCSARATVRSPAGISWHR